MSGVIIDTCMWSIAFRRKGTSETKVAKEITSLVDENRAKIFVLIRQEVLSGYSNIQSYTKLRDRLRYFPDEPALDADYEVAAEYSNHCRSRKNGIQGSHADFLICAVSARLKMKIYTNDKDFQHYSKYIPVNLHEKN